MHCGILLLCVLYTLEYDPQQWPYIMSAYEPVIISTVVSSKSSLMIGPVLVKNLGRDVANTRGQLCQYMMNGSTVGCCHYSLDDVPHHNGHVMNSYCHGELEGWTLSCSINCERGYLRYSLQKQGVHMNDNGKYFFIIKNAVVAEGVRATDVHVRNVASSWSSFVEYLAIIITLAALLAVVLCACCVVVCLLTGWKKCRKADPELQSLLGSSDGFVDVEGVQAGALSDSTSVLSM